MEEQAKAIGQGVKTTGPAMGCTSNCRGMVLCQVSLSKGYLDRLHAEAIIGAIEAFTSGRS